MENSIGPRKLAHALLESQFRWKESRESSMGSDESRDDVLGPVTPTSSEGQRSDLRITEYLSVAKLQPREPSKGEAVIVETSPALLQAESPDPLLPTRSLSDSYVLPVQARLPKPIPAPGESRASILIVDDNSINLKVRTTTPSQFNLPPLTQLS